MDDENRPLYYPLRLTEIEENERAERRVIAMMDWPQLQRVMDDLTSDPRQWNDPKAIRKAVQRRIKALGITEVELVQAGYY